jgi:hypothetical protein
MSPESNDLSIKAVSFRLAALFASASQPSAVRKLLTDLEPEQRTEIIASLVFEGVLSIAAGGKFVDQCAAYAQLVENESDIERGSRLAALAIDAIKHAYHFHISSADRLSERLYLYHRIPVTRCWKALWPDDQAVLEHIGMIPGGSHHMRLQPHFSRSSALGPGAQWLFWRRRERRYNGLSRASRHKLYFSPQPRYLCAALSELFKLLPASGATCFKIGPNAHGLLRPDKVIVYFSTFSDLRMFADDLMPRLAGIDAHGVPFSSQIDSYGLLSWALIHLTMKEA